MYCMSIDIVAIPVSGDTVLWVQDYPWGEKHYTTAPLSSADVIMGQMNRQTSFEREQGRRQAVAEAVNKTDKGEEN